MLDDAVARINSLYTQALMDGRLRPDPSLVIEEPVNASELDLSNAADVTFESAAPSEAAAGTSSFTVQFDTPNVASVGQSEGIIRTIPGVRSASTSSLALGAPRSCRSALMGR